MTVTVVKCHICTIPLSVVFTVYPKTHQCRVKAEEKSILLTLEVLYLHFYGNIYLKTNPHSALWKINVLSLIMWYSGS